MKTLILCMVVLLHGCASQSTVVSQQTITRAMVSPPVVPIPPNPDTATQREVAVYLVKLRGALMQAILQLKKVDELLVPDK